MEKIFSMSPSYQVVGDRAYKPGLEAMEAFDRHLGYPSRSLRAVHVAGTNGKGSVSHFMASVFASCGYRTALYTSPHLIDFRERAKICEGEGFEMIPREFVYDFVRKEESYIVEHRLSFFEITTGLAFSWFAGEKCDIAVIEVGLGGLMDSTNIITPILSVITNIALDHCMYLGHTLAEIAVQKAGIIKDGIPVVVGEYLDETRPVFEKTAALHGSELHFAQDEEPAAHSLEGFELQGDYERNNLRTVRCALEVLSSLGFVFSHAKTVDALKHAASRTGLRGRWEVLKESGPRVICDAGHNPNGLSYVMPQLCREGVDIIVFGVVKDRDLEGEKEMFPREAYYFFANAKGPRAMPCGELCEKLTAAGLRGEAAGSVESAVKKALGKASESSTVFIGGSCYVVAEALELVY
ncbi:MAG: Mur ligase family protein [Bacteroidales bacterium]|nr:Mur ligase family protein [Bacteroidales bacterium]